MRAIPKRKRKKRARFCCVCQDAFRMPRNAEFPDRRTCSDDCEQIEDSIRMLAPQWVGSRIDWAMTTEEVAESLRAYREAAGV